MIYEDTGESDSQIYRETLVKVNLGLNDEMLMEVNPCTGNEMLMKVNLKFEMRLNIMRDWGKSKVNRETLANVNPNFRQ